MEILLTSQPGMVMLGIISLMFVSVGLLSSSSVSKDLEEFSLEKAKKVCFRDALNEVFPLTLLMVLGPELYVLHTNGRSWSSSDLYQHLVFMSEMAVWVYFCIFAGVYLAKLRKLSRFKGGCDESNRID